jgi:hypothetical protein
MNQKMIERNRQGAQDKKKRFPAGDGLGVKPHGGRAAIHG